MERKAKPIRGTAVVLRDGKVLLVRGRGETAFSLPGGKRKASGEPQLPQGGELDRYLWWDRVAPIE